ncbi:Vascular endothelial growth factor receptor 1 [Orchesella cincta]|uniref:Vascular endothelial growth factor receptor 1 n=1 Tax=Orchesella cincta TaxID=48709 RepID=A0A1D2MR40_ORCCI|nr:Vascular endothelial growth factor receptor 1 [Orchesella cincta]
MRFLLYGAFLNFVWIILLFHGVLTETVTTAKPSILQCGKLDVQRCTLNNGNSANNCTISTETLLLPNNLSKNDSIKSQIRLTYSNDSSVLRVTTSPHCHLTLCDDKDLMGYCAHFSSATEKNHSEFLDILQSNTIEVECSCNTDAEDTKDENDDEHFDKNYVGVVYSPYDKYWENGPNGTKRRISWQDYTQDEISQSLRTIAKKFSYVSTFGIGTRPNTTEWYEGDMMAFVPKIAAEINLQLGYPALRLSVGIFRKDDVNLEWNSKELLNAVAAAKFANEIFTGSVWGITVTSQYATDAVKAHDVIEMINQVRNLNEENDLKLKIGIRLDTCSEFVAEKRPEDDAGGHTYFPVEGYSTPLTRFQSSLHEIAKISDYILCITFPPPKYAQLPTSSILEIMQKEFLNLKLELRKVNPKLKLIIETGVPSEGIGNGFKNSLSNLRQYWHNMAKFAKKEHLMFHMFEATDQPWKNIQDNVSPRFDLNGPNGTDAHFGWWRRLNNSYPPAYIEKVLEDKHTPVDSLQNVTDEMDQVFGNIAPVARILIGVVFGFVSLILGCLGCLWWKLRKARKEVISHAYVQQFHRGGEQFTSEEVDYAVALRMPYDRKYELAKGSFDIDKTKVMGSGQSGVVLKGTMTGYPYPVAFKCTTSSSTVVDIKNIMTEIKILCYIGEHDNVVCILGAYTRKIQRGTLYPFSCTHSKCESSLESFLRQVSFSEMKKGHFATDNVNSRELDNFCATNPGYVTAAPAPVSGYVCATQIEMMETQPNAHLNFKGIDFATLLQWSYQIASAMEFVSAKNVVHADLAARNVLLASMHKVKISDFGLSRKQYQEMSVTHDKDTPLPWRWMAPESLKNLVFSTETDVWGWAVTIWEICSLAEVPYHGITYNMDFVRQLEKGIRLPQAKYATPQLHELLLRCWSISPANRPNFTELMRFFETLTEFKNFNTSR